MFHVKDDFSKGPASQVPVSWFNSVGKLLNNLVGGPGIKITKNDDGTPATIERVYDKEDEDQKTTTDNTEASVEGDDPEEFGLTFENWEASANNGLKLRLYGLVDSGTNEHTLQPLDIEISPTGKIKSVKVPEGDHGINIGA